MHSNQSRRLLVCYLLILCTVVRVTSQRFYGIAYSPYRQYGHCPSYAEVKQDQDIFLAHTSRIRLYSTECDVLNDIVLKAATEHQIEVLLGVWIDGKPQDQREIQDLYTYIEKYPNAKLLGIAVGNEVLYRQTLSPQAMAQYVREVKQKVREIGQRIGSSMLQTVPVFSVDVIPHPQVVLESDAVGVNIHPFYRPDLPTSSDSGVMAGYALDSSIEHITAFQSLYPGKEVIVTETGWPSSSAPHEQHRGDLNVAKHYRQKFSGWADGVGLKYFMFELVDSPWKKQQYPNEPSTMSEFHWGIYTWGRTIK